MYSGETLLSWLTAEGGGTLTSLRDRLDWYAHAPILKGPWEPTDQFNWLEDMSATAYIDLAWNDNRWQVCPTVLTRLPAQGGLCAITGARPQALVDCLERSHADIDFWCTNIARVAGVDFPATLYLQPATESDLHNVAEELASAQHAEYVPCASSALSRCLPREPQPLPRIAGPVVGNAELKFLRIDAIGAPAEVEPSMWVNLPGSEQPDGAYRWRGRFGLAFGFREGGEWFGGARSDVLYHALRRRDANVLHWNQGESMGVGTLVVPNRVGLPPLQDRVATLALAQPAAVGRISRMYHGVTEEVARCIADSLGQQLDILKGSSRE